MRARAAARASVAALALVGSLTACSSTGDTGDLLLEGARACSTVCTSHPDVDAFSYRAGGGAPLLFLGTVEASCRCAAKARGADSPMVAPAPDPARSAREPVPGSGVRARRRRVRRRRMGLVPGGERRGGGHADDDRPAGVDLAGGDGVAGVRTVTGRDRTSRIVPSSGPARRLAPWPTRALLAAALASPLGTAHAQAELETEPAWRLSLGIGVYGVSGPFADGDDRTQAGVVPWFDAEFRRLHVDPTGLAVGLLRRDRLRIDVLAGPRLLTAEPSDDPAHRDIERDVGVDAGLRAVASLDRYTATLELRSDVSGTSDGEEAVLDLAAGFGPAPRLSLGIDAGVTWQDGDLSTYQYGVFPDEARDGRPPFEPGSTLTPFAGLQLVYAVTPKVSALLAVRADFLPDAVTDSPVVERGEVVTSFASVNYAF